MRPEDCINAAGVAEVDLTHKVLVLDNGRELPIVGLYDQKYRETRVLRNIRHCVAGPTSDGAWVTTTVSKLDRETAGR